LSLLSLLFVFAREAAHATTISDGDLVPRPPCTLTIEQTGSIRRLSWSAVAQATSYKLGYRRCDGTIVGLAEVTELAYEHQGWSSSECLVYFMVAYDSGGDDVCAARAAAGNCPCP
jgi:hypothetical protein